MALIVSLGLAFAASGLGSAGKAVGPYAPVDDFAAHLDRRIPALMERYHIPGCSIALVTDGRLVWSAAYGYADLESGRKLTTDTPMRVQSISKSVTAWGVMKLAEQGRLRLDAPVSQYLKNWDFPPSDFSADEITVLQLLSHTAGLPLGDVFTIYAPGDEMPSLEEKLTREAVPEREPGSAFSYSNTGYNLLELLVEEVTGEDFSEYMAREVLAPLGMRRSSFVWSEALAPAVPVGYDLRGRPVPPYVYPEKGSGGLFATAQDVAAFAIAGMGKTPQAEGALGSGIAQTLHTPVREDLGVYGLVFDAYGLGHYIETLPNGKQAVSHGGQGTGIMTHFHAVPETGDAIVILTNSQRSWPFIAFALGDWARWRGFGSVGMGRIIWAKYALWAAIGLIWAASALLALRLADSILRKKRIAAPRPMRAAQAGAAAVLTGGLIWCRCQPYLLVTSVFPRASAWLAVSALGLSAVLLWSAIYAREKI
ncbi:MAG TPA: serine hydrolase domain-containing protein [Terriglobales bacterium]|nr:serine hydrolase domain-containing protein [Terriglobales bacterium]